MAAAQVWQNGLPCPADEMGTIAVDCRFTVINNTGYGIVIYGSGQVRANLPPLGTTLLDLTNFEMIEVIEPGHLSRTYFARGNQSINDGTYLDSRACNGWIDPFLNGLGQPCGVRVFFHFAGGNMQTPIDMIYSNPLCRILGG